MSDATFESPLAGFWMGGFEGADHVNANGLALDMARASGHVAQLEADHERAASAGLRCVRESIGWRLAESADGRFDFERTRRIAASAQHHGLQVLWTVMHYGMPDGVSLHDDSLIDRFARFCAEVARVVGALSERAPVYTPINEIGYLAWGASQPDLFAAPNHTVGADPDSSRISGYAVKRRLVRACLAAMDAMRRADPRARFLHVEPIVHVVAPADRPELAELAAEIRGYQWQTWDLLSGAAEPELGGDPGALDLLGVNHYHSSQWEVGTERRLAWHLRDPRRMPLAALLDEAWQRYRRPLVLAETGHIGLGRANWFNEVAGEVRKARAGGIPVEGICLYPLVDRPDWNDPGRWHRSALWHVDAPAGADEAADAAFTRCVDTPWLTALQRWQQAWHRPARTPWVLLVFGDRPWEPAGHRTEQLMSRLAKHWHIVFVEPPRHGPHGRRLDWITQAPAIDILVPEGEWADADPAAWAAPGLQALLTDWWQRQGLAAPIAWLADPAARAAAQALAPRAWVRDLACRHPAAHVLASGDDLVFSALAPAPHGIDRRIELLPDGVDAAHFGRRHGGWDAEEVRRLQDDRIAAPRLGYAGAIDPTLDLALLDALAQARPQWQIVLAGALAGTCPQALPQRANLHWLGDVHYRLLPELMAGWQAGLLPLHSTAGAAVQAPFLQLLAAGLPVVASVDAGRDPACSRALEVAPDPASFIAGCERVLAEDAATRSTRRQAAQACVAERAWDDIAAQAQQLLAALARARGID